VPLADADQEEEALDYFLVRVNSFEVTDSSQTLVV
jgi:hypothetical protein